MTQFRSGDTHPRAFLLSCAATAQVLAALYLLVCGLVAAEMSALLSGGLLAYAASVAVAAVFLFRRRLWAWRLSLGLSALAVVAGLGVAFFPPAWLGGIHAGAGAMVLGALWAGRPPRA